MEFQRDLTYCILQVEGIGPHRVNSTRLFSSRLNWDPRPPPPHLPATVLPPLLQVPCLSMLQVSHLSKMLQVPYFPILRYPTFPSCKFPTFPMLQVAHLCMLQVPHLSMLQISHLSHAASFPPFPCCKFPQDGRLWRSSAWPGRWRTPLFHCWDGRRLDPGWNQTAQPLQENKTRNEPAQPMEKEL